MPFDILLPFTRKEVTTVPQRRCAIKDLRKNHKNHLHEIIVKAETAKVRPHVVGCVLRNITFDAKSYNSFIDLQDKLHQNICRRRTLASMGTHDLDKFANDAPITYEAVAPKDIVF